MKIPSQLIDFNLYNGDDRLIGTGPEITLPKVTSKTYTAELPAGDVDLPGMRTENMELEVLFNVLNEETASIMSLAEVNTVIIRGATQKVDQETHDLSYGGIKVTCRGFTKELDLGTLKRSDKMDSKVAMTLTYIKVENENGDVFIEVDKLNGTYIINGKDVRAGISQYL